MPNFKLYFPANVLSFYDFINNLETFNIVPTDWIFDLLGMSDSTKDENLNITRLLISKSSVL